MIHQRIASHLRDSLATVGPLPASRLHPVNLSSHTDGETHGQTGSNRLLLLPQPPPGSTPQSSAGPGNANSRSSATSLRHDLLAATAHRCSSFFAEAAVLVLVLGILDRFLASNRIELRWISGAFILSIGLLTAAVATDVTARRWLRTR